MITLAPTPRSVLEQMRVFQILIREAENSYLAPTSVYRVEHNCRTRAGIRGLRRKLRQVCRASPSLDFWTLTLPSSPIERTDSP